MNISFVDWKSSCS